MTPKEYKQMMDYLTRSGIRDQIKFASEIAQPDPKPEIKEIELFNAFNRRNPMAGGGMLVKPSADGSRPEYGTAKGSGIKLSAAQIKKLKENLSKEDFNKLDFDRTGVKADQVNYGVGQRDNLPLFRKVVNTLEPGKVSTGVKIINNKKLSDTLIKSANAGDDLQTIITKMNKLDKSLSKAQISSAINSFVARGQIKKEFGIPTGGAAKYGYRTGDIEKINKIIEEAVDEGKLNREQIARKANVSASVVEDWIRANKGDEFYKKNFDYKTGRLKTGNLQVRKDLFEFVENSDEITAKEISERFGLDSKKTQTTMSDLVGDIYRMRTRKGGSIIVPYDEPERLSNVLNKIRNAPDFIDIYQRRIGDLVATAYPKNSKAQKQAMKSLSEYYKFSRSLKEVAPQLALSLDHVVPFGFLKEVKQGANPVNLIKVKPIPQAVNRFKTNFDNARIEINRELKINPTDKNTLNKFKVLKELEQITPLEFGGVSAKGNVYDFKAKPIGQSNLIEDAIEGLKTYNRIGKFSQEVLTDEALQKKLIDAGVVKGKDFSAFKRITPLSKATEDKVINTIVSYSKLKKCQISLNADGGRIGFANSIECIQDGLNEAKKSAAAGDKKAARQLVETAEAASKGGRLLKNVLGPGTILGEVVFEGALIGNKLLEGKPLKQAWAESYLSYLDPRKYRGELDPTLIQRQQMLESTADKNILQSGFDAQDRISAFNKARDQEFLAEQRGRDDQLMTEAEREKLRAYEKQSSPFIKDSQLQKDADIISGEAFQDASNIAQEYIQGQQGQRMFPYNQFKQSIGKFESGEAKDYRKRKEEEMKNLYTQYSDDEVRSFLKQSLGTDDDKLIDRYLELTGVTKRITPAVTTTLSGLDVLRTGDQIQQAMQRIAEAGGVANLAMGGRAGFTGGGYGKDAAKYIKEIETDHHKGYQYYKKHGGKKSFKEYMKGSMSKYFAGGGIAKLAGVDQGPPPEKGPMSQGLQGLMKRGMKI